MGFRALVQAVLLGACLLAACSDSNDPTGRGCRETTDCPQPYECIWFLGATEGGCFLRCEETVCPGGTECHGETDMTGETVWICS